MKREEIESYYGLTLDEKGWSYLADYPDVHAEKPFVTEEEFCKAEELLVPRIPQECFDFLREQNAKIVADRGLNRAARFLRYALFEKREAWEAPLNSRASLFNTDMMQPKTAALLLVVACIGYSYLGGRIMVDDVNARGLPSVVSFTNKCHDQEGYWGINEWGWDLKEADGSLYHFHTLNFQLNLFPKTFLVLTNGREYVTLLKSELPIAQNGSLTTEDKPHAAVGRFTETAQAWVAHKIGDNGYADLKPSEFPKSEWKIALQEGDTMIGYHIPANTEYTPEQHRISMMQMLDFLHENHPETNVKGFICTSWLYSPQNTDLFAPDSKILAMERCVHLIGLATLLNENLMFLREGSTLHRRVADYVAGGREWHYGYCYVPLEQAMHFGEWTHEM